MPIDPSGSGSSGAYNIVARPSQVLPPLRPAMPRPLRTAKPIRSAGRTRVGGAAGSRVTSTGINADLDEPIDPTNRFRRLSTDSRHDTITISESLARYIAKLSAAGLLRIWSMTWRKVFKNLMEQPIKSFTSFAFGGDRPQYVDALTYGYTAGGSS